MTVKIGIASNHMIHPTKTLDTNYFDYIQIDYVDAVRHAGGTPVVLPIGDPSEAATYIEMVDGLLLAGGQGVTPVLYGTEPLREVTDTDVYRDRFEIALVKAAIAARKPILGICRGSQVINVALNGTLYQDIYSQMGATEKHNQLPTSWEIPTQHVTTIAGSWLDRLLGHRFLVNTFHHQAIHELGDGLTAVAKSDDNVIEAIGSSDGNVVGVQFHPERMFKTTPEFNAIFDYFIERAQ
ncbi:gamma-glutamyl-gamma-aminobutyrate hydrolase family protein [Lactobacillus sp. LC28-10]|uniref:Gamma-glutamyl-gamma-aminobutyrate hydrolase family protein n=1 Tax=Secundilactobacillus angelensis TaxID=2722706 RepID=A0ABX1KXF3_9LACO|nr:gamma-glutamyl-gamma-aminobutyrate hydrolase family protein [Secundilactobacillus angelensis]MCH5461787.1 gamma-glutamyl-gamma-aminobutyrate hydrolase family protein [Secundilactobacillus angelensis]NLR18626.1 gamma-glutamyl-gamma-aminobutyrate hydrolase family protein [Secundilactobacillus angelensis]